MEISSISNFLGEIPKFLKLVIGKGIWIFLIVLAIWLLYKGYKWIKKIKKPKFDDGLIGAEAIGTTIETLT